MTTLTTAKLSIAVTRGKTLDWHEYRHTSLFFEFEDGTPHFQAHAVGRAGRFVFEQQNIDPRTSARLAKLVSVGPLRSQVDPEQLLSVLRAVPILYDDLEYNCQNWCEKALGCLVDQRLLTKSDYETAFDGMIDAVMQAEDYIE